LIRQTVPKSETDPTCPKYFLSYNGLCHAPCPEGFSKDSNNLTQCIANDSKRVPPQNIYNINIPKKNKIIFSESDTLKKIEDFKNAQNNDCDYSTDYIILGCVIISFILFYYLRK
jgi:hypothetical protein